MAHRIPKIRLIPDLGLKIVCIHEFWSYGLFPCFKLTILGDKKDLSQIYFKAWASFQ